MGDDREHAADLTAENEALRTRVTQLEQQLRRRRDSAPEFRDRGARWGAVLENASIGYYFLDKEGYWRDGNRAFFQMLGYENPDELIGRHFDAILLEGELDDMAEAFRKLLEGESVVGKEARRRRRDGTIGYFTFTANQVISGGKVIGVEGFVIDLTSSREALEALRLSEERFRLLCECAPIGIYLSDGQGHNVYANTCLQSIGGLTAEQCLGDGWMQMVHPEDRASVAQAMAESARTRSEFAKVFRISTPQQEERWVAVRSAWLRSSDGQIIGEIGAVQDVTKIKLATDALRESEEKYRRLHESMRDAFARVDMTGRVVESNIAFQAMVGYSAEELGGVTYSDFTPPKWHELEAAIIQRQVLTRGHSDVYEKEYCRKDGTVFPVELRTFLLRDGSGRPSGMWAIVRDITERKRAEEEIRKFKTISDQSPQGHAIVDLDGNVLYVNDAFAAMHGYTAEELVGQHLSVFHAPEQMPAVDRLIGITKAKGGFVDEEVWHRRRDGAVFPARMTTFLIKNSDGRPLFLSAMAADISESKRMGEELERHALVFDNIGDAVIITDQARRITDWNTAAERIFGYTRDEVLGKNPVLLDKPGESPFVTRAIQEGIRLKGCWSGEIAFVRKDGTEGVCEVSLASVRDHQGVVKSLVGVNRDVTARKRAEKERTELEARLQQAHKMEAIGTLAGGIAHDFSNLLTAIFGYTDLARMTLPTDHPAVESLNMVVQSARQARGITNSLLTFTRKAPVEKKPVVLNVVLGEAVEVLRRLLPASVEIETDLQTEPVIWVRADSTQVQQIVLNLAVNARDAMPRGGKLRISLRQEPVGPAGWSATPRWNLGAAVVTVQDNGAGMSEETRSRIFEPFFTTKPRGQGTGLGMSVIHGIVADHGGRVDVSSAPGKGTGISVYLPCCKPGRAETEAPTRLPSPRGQGELITILEGDEHVRAILTSALRSHGYQVSAVGRTDPARGEMESLNRDTHLLVVDLDCSPPDGYAFLVEARQRLGPVPFVAVTSDPAEGAWLEPSAHGVLLRKPFPISVFLETIDGALERFRGDRANQ